MELHPPPFTSFNILVVEDEVLIALDLISLLEEGGYDVMVRWPQ